ncbi:hypothetical protein [Streptomyces fagopyri]|uniref:hypothetical protein n=1 Tax=Streptomyces fagopyri TaxID=2662397 RepID=UPI0037142E3E
MQIYADHRRALREPRKSAYVAFAESWWTRYNLLVDGWIELAVAEENYESSEYQNLISTARELRERVSASSESLEHAQAVVHVEGPFDVTDASVHAAGALIAAARCFSAAVTASPSSEAFSRLDIEFEAARSTAHEKYLAFLYAASKALEESVVRA